MALWVAFAVLVLDSLSDGLPAGRFCVRPWCWVLSGSGLLCRGRQRAQPSGGSFGKQFANEIVLSTNTRYLGRSCPWCHYRHAWLRQPLLVCSSSLCPGAQQFLSRRCILEKHVHGWSLFIPPPPPTPRPPSPRGSGFRKRCTLPLRLSFIKHIFLFISFCYQGRLTLSSPFSPPNSEAGVTCGGTCSGSLAALRSQLEAGLPTSC